MNATSPPPSSPPDFLSWVSHSATRVGHDLLYRAALLYFAAISPNCPAWARAVAFAALGYVIMPVDAVPDFIPGVGWTDDAVVVAKALVAIATTIDDDARGRARALADRVFGK